MNAVFVIKALKGKWVYLGEHGTEWVLSPSDAKRYDTYAEAEQVITDNVGKWFGVYQVEKFYILI
jgi:hypothetical protein